MIRTVLAAAVLSLAPLSVAAACSHGASKQSATVCAEGQTWDATTQTCVDASA